MQWSQRRRWPYDDLENPYELLYGLAEIRSDLQSLERDIVAEIPHQQRCRKRIVEAKSRLGALTDSWIAKCGQASSLVRKNLIAAFLTFAMHCVISVMPKSA